MSDTTLQVIFTGVDKTLGNTARGIGGVMGGVGKTMAAGLALGVTAAVGLGVAAVGVGSKLVGLGSDAMETGSLIQNSLGAATGDYTERLQAFASEANRSFYELQSGSSIIIAMTKSMGASEGQAADFGVTFAEMASDLGSFFNQSDTQVFEDLQSALAGSSETMQKYGIDVRETTLKQMALEQGLISSASDTLPQLLRAQLIQQAITEQGADAMGDAIRTSDSWANSTRGLKAMFTDFGTEIGMKLIPAIQPLLAQFLDMAKNVLPIVSEWITVKLIPAIATLGAWLGANLPTAIGIVSGYWTNVLQPAIEFAWAFLSATVIPYLQNVVIPFLQVAIPIALQFLSDTWTFILKPAIEAVWLWLSTVLMPFLQTVIFPWLQEHIPAALETLRSFWEDVLLPGIKAVWNFLTVRMMPIWKAIGDFLGVAFPLVLTALQGIWENVLLPAMTSVWTFLTEKLGPAFQWLKDSLIDPASAAFETLSGAIQRVADWIGTLTDKLSSITLPDWMTPGSPTPWENGLVGVQAALQKVAKTSLPALNMALNATATPAFADGGGLVASASGGGGTTINMDFRGSSGVDIERVKQAVREAMAAEGRNADARIRTR